MPKFSQFLEEHKDMPEGDFCSKFTCGLVLISKAASAEEEGSSKGFHTIMSLDARKSLTGGDNDPEVYQLTKGGAGHAFSMIAVGRTRNNDIVLESNAISKFHAYFKMNASSEYTVCDAGSTNGTTVNGRALAKNEPVTLRGGETIVFGNMFEGTFHTAKTLYRYMSIMKRLL